MDIRFIIQWRWYFFIIISPIFLNEFISAEEISDKIIASNYIVIPSGIQVGIGEYVTYYYEGSYPSKDELVDLILYIHVL